MIFTRSLSGLLVLPVPATYVIDAAGKVTYAFVDPDHTRGAEPTEIVAAVAALIGRTTASTEPNSHS